MSTVLWIIGIVVFVAGIFALVRKQWLWGAVLVVVGMIIGGFGFF